MNGSNGGVADVCIVVRVLERLLQHFSIHTADFLTSVAITGCDSGVTLFSIIWSSMVLDLVEIVMR